MFTTYFCPSVGALVETVPFAQVLPLIESEPIAKGFPPINLKLEISQSVVTGITPKLWLATLFEFDFVAGNSYHLLVVLSASKASYILTVISAFSHASFSIS